MAYRRWRPSRQNVKEFINTMDEIKGFCFEHGIDHSSNFDSYYFTINGQNYRVSNHSIEASNKGAYTFEGYQKRELYHPNGRDENTVYIHASKTRIIQIYNDLMNGFELNGRGYRK